ncbi:hypothetical protein BKA67DRAFT_526796 [Truncatella angustata]|uniref:ferric-chelate reductase (NADPH) n=1 Tax=Truncatella angustata TaxID=152316 RepID=A0A9P8RKI7_9PEZI|nr:uncharacterized protein BKA67DRAFT_526796 [Truncatella angustata]KAH6645736.1 hypothetical protein BKA67DRAFT_526796 [Truncatella angustata]
MDIILPYAISWCGVFLFVLLVNLIINHRKSSKKICSLPSRLFSYRYLMRRHKYIGPVTVTSVAAHVAYFALNTVCLTFRVQSLREAALRAGNLALLNLVPLVLNFSLEFWFDSLHIPLKVGLRMHRAGGWMCFGLVSCHVVMMIMTDAAFSVSENIYIISGTVSLFMLIILSISFLRHGIYEIFLKVHQCLAIGFIIGLCQHLLPTSSFQFRCLFCYLVISVGTTMIRSCLMMFRNKRFGHPFTKAFIREVHNAVHIEVQLSRALRIDAGQYLLLWIPNTGFWSFVQMHPFMVASWSNVAKDKLELVVRPRRGLTANIRNHCSTDGAVGQNALGVEKLAFFSGPYGQSIPVWDYRGVLLTANDFGIVALFPYLTKLIHGYRLRKGCTRRVHLVWHARELGECRKQDGTKVGTHQVLDHINSVHKFLDCNLEKDQSYVSGLNSSLAFF